jgi:membrane-bound serine protease (ClpP class)
LITAAFFIFVVGAGLRAQMRPAVTGVSSMIGRTAPAIARIDPSGGKVFIEGEYWNAVSETPVNAGEPVEIIEIEGLTLKVKPKAV